MLAIIVIAAVVVAIWTLMVVYVMPGVFAAWIRTWRRR